jgi:hypothetical protein
MKRPIELHQRKFPDDKVQLFEVKDATDKDPLRILFAGEKYDGHYMAIVPQKEQQQQQQQEPSSQYAATTDTVPSSNPKMPVEPKPKSSTAAKTIAEKRKPGRPKGSTSQKTKSEG